MSKPTKEFLKEVRVSIQTALDAIAKEKGFASLRIGNISYNEVGFHSKMECQFSEGESNALTTLRLNAPFLGFKPAIANAEIEYASKWFKVVGVKRTNLQLECVSTKKIFLAKIEDVKRALRNQKSPLIAE